MNDVKVYPLECPFCGSKADLWPLSIDKEVAVGCIKEGCAIKGIRTTLAKWNTRASHMESIIAVASDFMKIARESQAVESLNL